MSFGLTSALMAFSSSMRASVDVQTARRVEENHVVAVPDGVGDGGFRNVDRVRLPHLEDGDAELSADDLKLA